jgi:hypothetical protein
MMKAGIIALAALIASSATSLASVAYVVDLEFFDPLIEIEGFIATDGKVGVLSLPDIVSFHLIAGDAKTTIELSPDFAIVVLSGDDLVSTGRTLTFSYGASDGGLFGFHHIFSPPSVINWCNGAGGQSTCGQGIAVEGLFTDELTFAPVTQTLTIAAVPEVSTWVMLMAGFAGLGFMGKAASAALRHA